MTSPNSHLSPASSSRSPLSSATPLPIAQLDPSLPSLSSTSIKAIVTLIWPYSSSRHSISLLLAEPDFRLRRLRGQVRVHFHGSSAKAVARRGVGSGDVVSLGLDGAEWLRVEASSTPGRGIDWELAFTERLSMELNCGAHQSVVLDIDHPTPSPEPEAQASSPPRSPSPSTGSQPLSQPTQPSLNEWSSPAFLKRARSSLGSLLGSPYDPFADLDGFIEGKGRKRTKFWRDSSQWRYTDRTPSPEKETPVNPEDAMDLDEEVLDDASSSHAREPTTEEQASEGPAPGSCEGLAQAKELVMDTQNELVSVEPDMENLSQLGATAAGSRGKELNVQGSDSNIEEVHGMGDTVLSSPGPGEPVTSPPPADCTTQLESSDIYTSPHMPHPPVTPLQTGPVGVSEGGVMFSLKETPSSPILRPIPSPSLPAVSPFGSSWTETTDYFDPVQTRTLPGSGKASEHGRADGGGKLDFGLDIDHLDVEREEQYPLTSQPTIWASDLNTHERLEPGTDEVGVADAHPTNLPYAVQHAEMAESRGSGGEQESLRTYDGHIRDDELEDLEDELDRVLTSEIERAFESETDEFEDDEREELYSAIIPQLRQFATANALDERQLQIGGYEEGQGNLHSSILPEANPDVGIGVDGKSVSGSEDSDSDDLQSVSQGDQTSDAEMDEECGSDEGQYDGHAEGYGDDSEQDESEGDGGESYSSSPTPVPPKMTQEVEVIDLISDDEDEPQQGGQSGTAMTQPSHFGLDGTAMSSLVPKPKADSFAGQWDKVIATQNKSRGEWRTSEEEVGESAVHGTSAKGGKWVISHDEVDQAEGVSSQAQEGIYQIEQGWSNESEGGSLGEIQCHSLEANHGTDQTETLREGKPGVDGDTKAPVPGEAQPASGSATGIPSKEDDLPGKEVVKVPDTEGDEGHASTSPRVDTLLGEMEPPPDHGAEEYGALNSEGDPRESRHRLLDPTYPDLTDAQLQSEPTWPLRQKLEREDIPALGSGIPYPTLPTVQTEEYSYPPSFATEPYIQFPNIAFDGELGLQLPTPDETQRTLVSSQLSASSEHLDAHTILDTVKQGPPNQTPPPPTPQTNPAPTAPQEVPKLPPSFTPPPSQGQPPFSPPASQLDNMSSQLPVSPIQESQATNLTSQQTQAASLEPPETPTSSQLTLLHKLREVKSASGKKQRAGRNAVPGVISPWFTTTEVDQPVIDTEEDTQRPPFSTRASPSLADGEQALLPQNGHTLQLPSPTVDAVGITTSLSYFSLLSTLQALFSQIVDALAIVTRHQPTEKARRGSRDYVLSLAITDPSISTSISVAISRPFKTALPIVSDGDGILLRGFKVTSQKRKLLLQSTDVSSWAVFKSDGEVQVRGPPVEYGQGEAQQIEALRQWWQGLEVQKRVEVAAGTQDEQHDIAEGPRSSEPIGNS
ncbi:MAG: hypothetical protein M1840_006672 [Geoglossum simile]|nr:MAG: hypothetical protein M1840_006672 [Geoglossum simile]